MNAEKLKKITASTLLECFEEAVAESDPVVGNKNPYTHLDLEAIKTEIRSRMVGE